MIIHNFHELRIIFDDQKKKKNFDNENYLGSSQKVNFVNLGRLNLRFNFPIIINKSILYT